MSEMQKGSLQEAQDETVEEKKGKDQNSSSGSVFEGIYDRLPDISVRAVNRFIILCIIALIVVILVGVLKANHFI